MKKFLLCVLFSLSGAPLFAQSHPEVVASVKSDLETKHVDLSGPCGAFQITKRVAWQLRAEGAGLLDKSSGNNCMGFAVDIIAYQGNGVTRIFDILVDSGGSNGPAWQAGDPVESFRYRSAFDPGDTASSGGGSPVVDTGLLVIVTAIGELDTRLAWLESKVDALAKKETDDTAAIRGDIKDFRDAAKGVWKQLLKWAPAIGGVVTAAIVKK